MMRDVVGVGRPDDEPLRLRAVVAGSRPSAEAAGNGSTGRSGDQRARRCLTAGWVGNEATMTRRQQTDSIDDDCELRPRASPGRHRQPHLTSFDAFDAFDAFDFIRVVAQK